MKRIHRLGLHLIAFLVLAASAGPAEAVIGMQIAFPSLPYFFTPIGIEDPMDGTDRLFVIEKNGRIRVFQNEFTVSSAVTFLDIQNAVDNRFESGLCGLAFHPDYEHNGYFYITYSSKPPSRTILARFHVSSDPNVADPASELRLIEIPQVTTYHKAGGLAFGPDGYLWMSVGEDGQIYDSQDLSSLKGKILRINVDAPSGGLNYSIPVDNPFAGSTQGWRQEIWAYGFRNPWRFSFDPPTGNLWLGDVGLSTWEEVNLVKKGRNYGWPRIEGTQCDYPVPCDTTGLNIDMPVYQYLHVSQYGEAVIGGYVYHGTALPSLVGRYIYADHPSDYIWALDYDGVNPPTNTPIYHYLAEGYIRITDFCVDKDNELFIATYYGGIYHLVETPVAVGDAPAPVLSSLSAYPNPFTGETRIRYESSNHASIDVYDVQGRFVRRLTDGAAGSGEVVWDGRDNDGLRAASGVYFARLAVAGKAIATQRVVLLR